MTLDLGRKSGKLLIFGGVYSNLEALEAMYIKAKTLGIKNENIICTGDLTAYCADPEECMQFIKKWGIHTIAGNVELNLTDDADDCGCSFRKGSRCDQFSKQWYPYIQENISRDSIQYIQEIPEFIRFEYYGKKVFVLHGSVKNTSQFIFESTSWEIKEKIFGHAQADIIIAGHCGLPFLQHKNNKIWYNPGVIGMPANDGTARVWYGIIQPEKGNINISIRPLEYDHGKAARKIYAKTLPKTYGDTLNTGIWDNMEILSPAEREQQGLGLVEREMII